MAVKSGGSGKTALVLIDGHHYLHVLKAALSHVRQTLGYSVVGAVLLGKPVKFDSPESLTELEIPVVTAAKDLHASIAEACRKFEPDVVLDLSGEPVLDLTERLRIAQALLARGITYAGADFQFSPAQRLRPNAPTLAVLGAGKRVGKTAICAFTARRVAQSGLSPVIVTMGRGGPVEPQLLRGDRIEFTPEFFTEEQKLGRHAASDNYEEALLAGVPTIGCCRAGSGIFGTPFWTTLEKGIPLANSLNCDIQIYEGSGQTAPPVRLDARILVLSAAQPPARLEDSPAVQDADIIVITGCEEPLTTPAQTEELINTLHSINDKATIRTVLLRPEPLGDLKGKKVVLATTAPESIVETLVSHIEQTCDCKVVGKTADLSESRKLKDELTDILEGPEKPEVLLTELKAASVRVACVMAASAGVQVVFYGNVPRDSEPREGNLGEDVVNLARLALRRYSDKHSDESGA